MIVAMFASNIHRVQMVVDSAAMFGRRVCFVGRSMVNVTRVAMSIGELSIPEENLIDVMIWKTMPTRRFSSSPPAARARPWRA